MKSNITTKHILELSYRKINYSLAYMHVNIVL